MFLGLGWVGLGWVGLGWVGLGWVGLVGITPTHLFVANKYRQKLGKNQQGFDV